MPGDEAPELGWMVRPPQNDLLMQIQTGPSTSVDRRVSRPPWSSGIWSDRDSALEPDIGGLDRRSPRQSRESRDCRWRRAKRMNAINRVSVAIADPDHRTIMSDTNRPSPTSTCVRGIAKLRWWSRTSFSDLAGIHDGASAGIS